MLQENNSDSLTNHYIFHNTDKLQLVTNMQHVLFHSPYYVSFLKYNNFLNDASTFLGRQPPVRKYTSQCIIQKQTQKKIKEKKSTPN